MRKDYEDGKLRFYMDTSCLEFCCERAGNPKSISFPCKQAPKAIDALAQAESGSGHDCFLKGIVVYIDWSINKIIREQLLRYNFINVISSQSLMHCFEDFKLHGKILKVFETVDEIPLSFEYGISFQTNYLQLKTIYKQRKTHKRKEWQDFCAALEKLPESHFITGGK